MRRQTATYHHAARTGFQLSPQALRESRGKEAAKDPNLSPLDFLDACLAAPADLARNPGLGLLLASHPNLTRYEAQDDSVTEWEHARALANLARQDVPHALLTLL